MCVGVGMGSGGRDRDWFGMVMVSRVVAIGTP